MNEYINGKYYWKGDNEDIEKALFFFEKSGEKGYMKAQYKLGIYYNGERKDLEYDYDHTKAVYWFTKAAIQNHIKSQFKLGECYYIGDGVDKDYKQAFFWWKRSGEQGHEESQNNLYCLYQNGLGVKKDIDESFRWLQKAIKKENKSITLYNIAEVYEKGEAIKKDLKKALFL
jgi:TPR repeat protein